MELKNLFKLGAVAMALSATIGLSGCGGDININTGNETVDPTPTPTPDPDKSDQEKAYEGFATKSTTFVSVDGKEVWELKGTLAPSSAASTIGSAGGQDGNKIVLGNDVVWMLDGAVIAGGDNADSVELEIQPGTKVLGGSDSYLVVSRGSQIMAEGTKDEPIVFTSSVTALGQEGEAGQWGG
ncbi:hypothetical protein [Shewanella maritima]|uniref:hypothetical protein n=2 Tax=Shewanella TaxID=22 RepID=UPI001F5F7383|nr:hypothetical protein [Shewanella maritima]